MKTQTYDDGWKYTTTIILRDYKNKVVFSAIYKNTDDIEALMPIIML